MLVSIIIHKIKLNTIIQKIIFGLIITSFFLI